MNAGNELVTRKGGELIVDHLVRSGMRHVFGICGHGNVGFIDALHARRDEIEFISPRHEQIAGHMADAYFRVAHRPATVLASCGPGACNLVMPTACAHADSSAFLALTANVPTSQFNRAPFQESYRNHQAEFPAVLRPYVKRSFQPTRVDMLPLALTQATQLLTQGRPGPVHLDVPFNLFQEEAQVPRVESKPLALDRPAASPIAMNQVLAHLVSARRPALFVGHGVTLAQAAPELRRLVHLTGIPVISSPNGMGTLQMDSPLSVGFIGRNGAFPANQVGRHCDVLIAVGARFDDRSSSSWIPGYSWNFDSTRLIHVDIDPSEIGRNYVPALGIVADAQTFLHQLCAAIEPVADAMKESLVAWRAEVEGWQARWREFTQPHFGASGSPMRPERVVRDTQSILPEEAILSLDSGVHHNWFMQFWKASRPQTMLNSWGFSAMGFGVAGVLGAKLAAPDRPCVAVVGDGGFTMCPSVLCTAVEYGIPAVWVVWNNFAWGAIRDIQHGLFAGREYRTAFRDPSGASYNPDFVELARSYGADGYRVDHSDQYADALRAAIASNRPCVLDVRVDAEVHPPSTGAWALPPLAHKEPVFGGRVLSKEARNG